MRPYRVTRQLLGRSQIRRSLAVSRSGLLIAALLALLALGARQTNLLDKQLVFFPDREVMSTPGDAGLVYEDVTFTASDGVKLHGWFVPGDGKRVIIWFHGNAGNIGHRVENLVLMREQLRVSVFLFDYRGYGNSEGAPSEQGLYLDAEAALEYTKTRTGLEADEGIVYFGRSLGAAVAVELATRYPPRALVLESPFTSIQGMAQKVYPVVSKVVPLGLVVQSRFDALAKIGQVRTPVMVLHGDQDDMIPIEMGRELFEAANEPKAFYAIRGASHNDTYAVGGVPYFDALRAFVNRTD
ncbi:MAG: alpha/beta hydrolase [Chloroflexi bacterium]|nr:alpha/beta hydrolase [Chloroflexota bacterium]MCH7652817.1 alpha/beta hydrolase [Chloroflexota bacterium]